MAKYECLKCGNKYKSISGWTHHLTQEENDDLKKYIARLKKDYSILQIEYYELREITNKIFNRAKEVKKQRDLFYVSLETQRKRGIYIDDDFIYDESKGPFIYKIPKTGAEYFIFSRRAMAKLAIDNTGGKKKLIEGVRDKLTTKEKELKKLQRATSGKKDNLEKLKKLYSSALATIKNNEATIAELTAKAHKKDHKGAISADTTADSTTDEGSGPTADQTHTATTADDKKILYDFEILNKFAKSLIYERTGRKPLYISIYYLTTLRGLDCYFLEVFGISLDDFIDIFNKLKALRLTIAHPPTKKLDFEIIKNVINCYQCIK